MHLIPGETELGKDMIAVQQIPAVQSILEIIRKTTGMGFAAVARVTEHRWIACAVNDGIAFGLKAGGELKVETTICHEIRQQREAVIIDHVSKDTTYCNHRTPAMYGFESYISVPIILKDGSFFGTLCAIDPKPAALSSPHVREMFYLFSQLIAHNLDRSRESDRLAAQLEEEKNLAELREQFIAIIGHDLRNPLSVCLNGAEFLANNHLSAENKQFAALILSASKRMKGLLDNLMDFAQGKLGAGLSVTIIPTDNVGEILQQIVSEHKSISPATDIRETIFVQRTMNVDGKRIGQLFSNLLSNALAYGKTGQPVSIEARTENNHFFLSVTNATDPIEEKMLEQLFLPYMRGKNNRSEGLGLGLFIASQIAKAHGGTINAKYTNGEIEFTFTMSNGEK